jgi:hypothetical protein
VSENTLRRVAEDAGRQLGERLAQGDTIGPAEAWDWETDRQGRTVAYVSIDATGIGMQGPRGAKAEGRMPYVGMVYNPEPRTDDASPATPVVPVAAVVPVVPVVPVAAAAAVPPPRAGRRPARKRRAGQTRYLAGLMGLPELGRTLRQQGLQVGVAAADAIVGLTDGGAGLAECLRSAFPEIVLILDFWHAAEHLADFSKVLHPGDSAAATAWFEEHRHVLRHDGGLALLKRLLNLDLHDRDPAVQAEREKLLGYVGNNLYRMDYPTYAARGWRIGSGPVEAACKTVVNARLCLVGMRWGAPGADGMCHLRALYRGEPSQWLRYWNPPPILSA